MPPILRTEITAIDIEVGARVRLRRKLLGLSQSALAEKIGITFQQVQKYEKGANRIGSSRIHQIAVALETSPAWLFGEDGAQVSKETEVRAIRRMVGSDEGAALNMAFAKISDTKIRRSVLALVKALAANGDVEEDIAH